MLTYLRLVYHEAIRAAAMHPRTSAMHMERMIWARLTLRRIVALEG